MELSSLTQRADAHVYRDQATPLHAVAVDVGLTAWPAEVRLHAGEINLLAVLSEDGTRADWSVAADLVEAMPASRVGMWIGVSDGAGEHQVTGGSLFRHDHGVAGDAGMSARIIIGPTGKSAYQAAVDAGFEGTEAEWVESLGGIHAIPDPDNPDLLLITYPTYATAEDGTSILIPLEV